tara:strand:+ start:184 stop:543 length:360 start_codon:yes stop_codon:yes gene_type:complete
MFKDLIPWGWAPKGYLPRLFVTYRLTERLFNALWTEQRGRCAGCEHELAHPLIKDIQRSGLKPEVDHDHAGGNSFTDEVVVRGLLCQKCNALLGKIKDNQELLIKLQAYLKDPPFAKIG